MVNKVEGITGEPGIKAALLLVFGWSCRVVVLNSDSMEEGNMLPSRKRIPKFIKGIREKWAGWRDITARPEAAVPETLASPDWRCRWECWRGTRWRRAGDGGGHDQKSAPQQPRPPVLTL